MDKNAVEEYIECAQETIESAPQMKEATTKAAVLRDFLEILNWEIPTNTQLEYSVKAFNRTYKVDYALVLERTPVGFLEAKGVDTPLTEKHRKQLEAYLKNEDVNWGILTNGKVYEFYHRKVVNSKVQVKKLDSVDLQNLSSKTHLLHIFTKKSIQSGESEKIAKRIHELKAAKNTLDTDKTEIANEIIDLLTERVSEEIQPHAQAKVKEMLDRLNQSVSNEIGAGNKHTSGSSELISSKNTVKSEEPEFDGRYGIEFLKDEEVVCSFSSNTQVGVFVEAVECLVESHGLIEKLEPLPYIPGRKRPVIHHEIQYEGLEFTQPWELSNEYFIETNTDSKTKQRELKRLVNMCGMGVEFKHGW